MSIFSVEEVEADDEEDLPRAVPKRRGRKAPPSGSPGDDHVDAPHVARLTEHELQARANETSQSLRELEVIVV